ncbi:hypothetical protein MHYP_G00050270, partial [Metynnis hypsauchen]
VVLGVERSVCCVLSVVYRASVVLGVERSVCCELSVVLLVRMLLIFYLLFIGLHVSEGWTLVKRPLLSLTAQRGGSVLLPCYCTDLQTKPETFFWWKYNTNRRKWEEISSESGQYRNRVQLVNGHSPGNLSLLISHLTEEDGGEYVCVNARAQYINIRLTIQEGPPTTTTPTAVVHSKTSSSISFADCTLVKNKHESFITAHTGGSVLLPCYCTDLHTKPERFTWKKFNTNTFTWEEISSESGQYRERVQLVNVHSPGNLSLLISHLTEEDGGDYRCDDSREQYINIRLTIQVLGPPKPTAPTTVQTIPSTTTASYPQPSDCCTLVNRSRLLSLTAQRGRSVLLPCYCTDLQTKPETFIWKKFNTNTCRWEEISSD